MLAPALALALCAGSPATLTLAAPGLKLSNLKQSLAEPLNEHLALQLTAKGFKTVTSADIAAVLGLERQKQLLGCAESSTTCLAEMAGAMGVDGIVQGSVVRLGKRFQITVKIISGQDGGTLAVSSEAGSSDDELFDSLTVVSERLAEQLQAIVRERNKTVTVARPREPVEVERPAERALEPAPGVRRWWWIPAGLSVGFAVGATVSFLQAVDASRLLRSTPVAGFDAPATLARGQTGATLGWIFTGAALAAAATSVAFLLFGEPAPVNVSAWWLGSSGGVTARVELP